ncbi:MAG: S-layer protein, partial [Methanoregulaceae archaeon]|nr:S-layer protein [Methanoregulaceae archaeon]
YGIDSEIRYRDSLENSQISDTMKVQLSVVPQDGLPFLLGVLVVVVAAAGGAYYFFVYRKKK